MARLFVMLNGTEHIGFEIHNKFVLKDLCKLVQDIEKLDLLYESDKSRTPMVLFSSHSEGPQKIAEIYSAELETLAQNIIKAFIQNDHTIKLYKDDNQLIDSELKDEKFDSTALQEFNECLEHSTWHTGYPNISDRNIELLFKYKNNGKTIISNGAYGIGYFIDCNGVERAFDAWAHLPYEEE